MKKIDKPHDKLFKEVMGDIETAKSFIQNYLPPKIVRSIDPESIAIETDSYLEKDLSEYFFDLLFRVKMQQEEGYVYLLFEHKSKVDKHVNLQLLGYMTSIWKWSSTKGERNGKRRNGFRIAFRTTTEWART